MMCCETESQTCWLKPRTRLPICFISFGSWLARISSLASMSRKVTETATEEPIDLTRSQLPSKEAFRIYNYA